MAVDILFCLNCVVKGYQVKWLIILVSTEVTATSCLSDSFWHFFEFVGCSSDSLSQHILKGLLLYSGVKYNIQLVQKRF